MNRSSKLSKSIAATSLSITAACLALTVAGNNALAQQDAILEEIIVTATKRDEHIMDVPISITAMTDQRLNNRFSGGETILALASAAPGLYAESSNGRHAPRFYMRGLGNADFDQASSQPVSIVFDEVAMEQVTLKAFPVFDLESVEVIRGPQGTLYGRNTTAGIVKLNSRGPTQDLDGYVKASVGSLNTINAEGAIGGRLFTDSLSGRASMLYQKRGNWIDNGLLGETDWTGGHEELAARFQLLWLPTDNLSIKLLYQTRNLTGQSASAFRANIIAPGTNELNSNYVRERIWWDGGGGNHAEIEAQGMNLYVDWDIGSTTLTSISSYQDANQFARGDIDGGLVDPTLTVPPPDGISCVDAGFVIPIFGPARTCPDFIFISSDTGGNNHNTQFTQEFRLSSNNVDALNWQVGAYYFEDSLSTSTEFGVGPGPMDTVVGSIALHKNTAWAAFGQVDMDFADNWTVTAGIRYTDDEKTYSPTVAPPTQEAILLQDDNWSGNVTLAFRTSDTSQIWGRIASGFRAPSIQARNAAFGGPVTVADSETIISYELGYKADITDRFRLNSAVFYYDVSDMQLTAIGGAGNFTTLLNAQNGTGVGLEFDLDWVPTDNLVLSAGFGYAKTEIKDPTLSVTPGIGAVTVTDPIDANGNAIINGNPFQHAPEWTLNAELSYVYPLSSGNELFFFTDWKVKGKTNDFLYESVEFYFDTQFEGGLRAGYRSLDNGYEVALFGRNITDEDNPIGGIDFSNTTSYVNEPRIWGVEASFNFGGR